MVNRKFMDFKVTIKGLEKGEKKTVDKAKRVLKRSMFKMEELALRRAPFDQGDLRKGITLFPQILADKYFLISAVEYSEDLEYGNTPRQVKLDVLIDWAERKGIVSGNAVIPFAKYVQEKIKTEGVNAQPFFRPALFETRNVWYPKFLRDEFSGINK